MAMMRGVVLLAVALILGIILLQKTDSQKAGVAAAGGSTTTSTARGAATTLPSLSTTTTAATRSPQTVKVLAANGTDVQGAAGRVNQVLLAGKYNALSPTDASAKVQASSVYFNPGFDREAAVIAQLLVLPPTAAKPMPTPLPVKDLHSADILVMVGPELAGRLTATSSSTTSTTAKKASTTTTTAHATSSTTTTAKP